MQFLKPWNQGLKRFMHLILHIYTENYAFFLEANQKVPFLRFFGGYFSGLWKHRPLQKTFPRAQSEKRPKNWHPWLSDFEGQFSGRKWFFFSFSTSNLHGRRTVQFFQICIFWGPKKNCGNSKNGQKWPSLLLTSPRCWWKGAKIRNLTYSLFTPW